MVSKRHKKTLESLKQAYREADNNIEQVEGEFSRGSKEYRKAHQEWLEAVENLSEFEDFLDELDARYRSKDFWNAFWIALVGTGMILLLAGLIVPVALVVAYETLGGLGAAFLGIMIVIGLKVFTCTFKFAKEDSK